MSSDVLQNEHLTDRVPRLRFLCNSEGCLARWDQFDMSSERSSQINPNRALWAEPIRQECLHVLGTLHLAFCICILQPSILNVKLVLCQKQNSQTPHGVVCRLLSSVVCRRLTLLSFLPRCFPRPVTPHGQEASQSRSLQLVFWPLRLQ